MFPDRRARPRTSRGRAIHIPGPAGEASAPARTCGGPLTLAEEVPLRAPRGAPAGRVLHSLAGLAGAEPTGPLPSHLREQFLERPQAALEAERLRCKSRVSAGSSVGNFTTNGWAGETTPCSAPFSFLAGS